MIERHVGCMEGQKRGNDDEHALEDGGQIFGLVVAKLVMPVGRAAWRS